MRRVANGQQSLFTYRGSLYSRETQIREIRADILSGLGKVFGERNLPQKCPECGDGLTLLMHPEVPYAWCECGFALSLNEKEVEELSGSSSSFP